MGYCGSYLPVNGYLSTWDYITSNNDLYTLVMQSDGNLCVYLEAVPTFGTPLIWQSGPTAGGGVFHAVVETDGALSVYAGADPASQGAQIWTSGSSALGGQFFLWMQPTGNLSLFAGTDPNHQGAAIWDAGPVPQPNPPPPAPTPTKKLQQLGCFAPLVWLAQGEEYMPCSVDWSFPFLERYANPDDGGRYWLRTKLPLADPSSDNLPSFAGNLASAKIYAFWVPKDGGCTDLIYFIYFGYDRGKPAANTIWGSHVGDWEHVTVRLDPALLPIQVYLSQHADGAALAWGDVQKKVCHPLVYSASGSHALYAAPGDYKYANYGIVSFTDNCSAGTAWDTSGATECFDYAARQGLGPDAWPRWMDTDYTTPGPNPADPASGPIYRWGNQKQGCTGWVEKLTGQCRLNDGPTGPADKGDCWAPNTFG